MKPYWVILLSILVTYKTFASEINDPKTKTALPLLQGIIFEQQPARNEKSERFPLSPSLIELTHSREIDAIMKPYLGHPLSFAQIEALKGKFGIFFRLHDKAFLSVNVPPQIVKKGILHIALLEYRLGRITVHNSHWSPNWTIRRDSGLISGQTLSLVTLQTDCKGTYW